MLRSLGEMFDISNGLSLGRQRQKSRYSDSHRDLLRRTKANIQADPTNRAQTGLVGNLMGSAITAPVPFLLFTT